MRTTVGHLLRNNGLAALDARALLAQALGRPREHLVAHPEWTVDPARAAAFEALVAQRREGIPLAYLTGVREFYGREFRVTPDVLIPRPDTETLVEVALECLRGTSESRVVDLGTGSGCIAITLKLERPDARVSATDVSAKALVVARTNGQALSAEVEFRLGDWYAALPAGAVFDLIVANPPYVAPGDPHLAELVHEPPVALTDDCDGLASLRTVIAGAHAYLAPNGWLAVEHGYDQGAAVSRTMAAAGFRQIATRRDASGLDRVTLGSAAR